MSDWWRDCIIYQVYPRSFVDSDGDGVGDLAGVIERLDHLAWLGIDAIWLNPVTASPNDDWGYDVSEYLSVHPDLGTLADADRLMEEAGSRGIRVLLDFVPNHTSDRHPWFVDARSSRDAEHRDWYVWADPGPGGAPPNNWLSVFGGPAWTLDEPTGQYYLHNFLATQPDLNWWNEDVRLAFDEILRFWFDRGVAGVRIDVAHAIVKDRELRDNLPSGEDDHPIVRRLGQRQVYNMNRPEVHDVLRRWKGVAQEYDPARVLLGETYVLDVETMVRYYGRGDELDLAFNFPFVYSPFQASELRLVVEETERLMPAEGWPVWTASNHDAGRFPSRWCAEDQAAVRCALTVLLTLRGTPVLYYGDEIGMTNAELAYDDLRDPVGLRFWPENRGRDGGRTPMLWGPGENAGFTSPGVETWLPVGEGRVPSVEEQRDDPESVMRLTRDLIALRRSSEDLRRGDYRTLPAPPGTWAWRRGERTVVAVNLGDRAAELEGLAGKVEQGTDRARDGEEVEGSLLLSPMEAAVITLRP